MKSVKMRRRCSFHWIPFIIIIFGGYMILRYQFHLVENKEELEDTVFIRSPEKYREIFPLKEIVWWKRMAHDYHAYKICGSYQCVFTGNTENISTAAAVIFYGSSIPMQEFPLPRPNNQIWAVFHEESLLNCIFFSNNAFLRHFNITSTFSRYSDMPLTTLSLPSLAELTDISYYKSHEQKSKNSPVLFLQSNCATLSRREEYVRELMQYIEIDSYGSCLNNKNQSSSLQNDYLNKLYSAEPLHLMSEYKFVLSIENVVCEDYITEKFWRPLVAGSIPLYFGSPSIRDWAPNNKSVIYIDDFENAKALATFLHQLSNNSTEYLTYLKHKLDRDEPISNKLLIKELSTRPYQEVFQVFSAFECHVCTALNENAEGLNPANIDHYNCPLPPRQLPTTNDDIVHSNQLKSLQQNAECMAKVMDDLLVKNLPFSFNYSNSLIQLLCNKEQYNFNKEF